MKKSRTVGAVNSPAHHFVGEQDSAHLWVLVLTLVDDCLKSKTNLNNLLFIKFYRIEEVFPNH